MKNILKLMLAAGAVALATNANAVSITIANNSFEDPTSGGSFDTITAPDTTSIPGWDVSSGSVDHIGTYWQAADGVRSLDMNGISAGTISQFISIPAAGSLDVNFYMSGNPDGGPATKNLRVTLAGIEDFTYLVTGSLGDMDWVLKTASFSIPSAGSYLLKFESLDAGSFGAALDNVSAEFEELDVTTHGVPDGGASVVLLGISLLAMGAGRKLMS